MASVWLFSIFIAMTPEEEFFELDRRYNTPVYDGIRDTRPVEAALTDLFYWDVKSGDLKRANLINEWLHWPQRDVSDESTRNFNFYKKDQRRSRFYSLAGPNYPNFEVFQKIYGKPTGSMKALRISGKNTYSIFPENGGSPIGLKILLSDSSQGHMNDSEGLVRGIINTGILMDILGEYQGQPSIEDDLLPFFPELGMGQIYRKMPDDQTQLLQSYSVREYSPVFSRLKPNQKLVPLKALFDFRSGLLGKFADKRGWTKSEWLENEYLPKLAEFSVRMHFLFGMYHESHTQNLLAVIDEETGKIVNFVIRDTRDVIWLDLAHTSNKRRSQLELLAAVQMRGHLFFTNAQDREGGRPLAYTPGKNISDYLAQSAVFSIDDRDLQISFAATFLRSYWREMEAFFGKPIPLGSAALYTLRVLESQSFRIKGPSDIASLMEIFFDDLFLWFLQKQVGPYERDNRFLYDQLALSQFFASYKNAGITHNLAAGTSQPDAEGTDFLYGFNNFGLIQVDPETGDLLRYVPREVMPRKDFVYLKSLSVPVRTGVVQTRMDPVYFESVGMDENSGIVSLRNISRKGAWSTLKAAMYGNQMAATAETGGPLVLLAKPLAPHMAKKMRDCTNLLSKTNVDYVIAKQARIAERLRQKTPNK